MDINWEERLNGTERLGFSLEDTQAAFHYSYPKKSLDKICLKCTKCSSITPWCVGDFYRLLIKQDRAYSCKACKKYTLKTIQQKVDDIFGEGLITVAPDQKYVGIRKPLRFIDRDYGEWTTPPFNLITSKNTHPERSKERRKQTNLAKYGHENAFGSKQIQEKIRKTNMEKYGVENPMHDPKIKQKLKETNVAKYGCAVPLVGNKDVLGKVKKTNLERYGREKYANVTHDRSHTLEYQSWVGMRSRCYNEKDTSYSNYGKRGIIVCEAWLESFDSFYADMGDIPKDGHRYSIERRDNNKSYTPDNCYWATYTEQANNRRNNINLTYIGRTQTLAQWCEELGLNRGTVWSRLKKRKWSVERTLSTPARKKRPRFSKLPS